MISTVSHGGVPAIQLLKEEEDSASVVAVLITMAVVGNNLIAMALWLFSLSL